MERRKDGSEVSPVCKGRIFSAQFPFQDYEVCSKVLFISLTASKDEHVGTTGVLLSSR